MANTCTKCGIKLTEENAYVRDKSKHILYPTCKACTRIIQAEYRARNRDKINAQKKESYARNIDKARAYYAKNSDTIKRKAMEYSKANRKKLSQKQRKYRELHSYSEYNKRYFQEHKEYFRNYARSKRKNDLQYKITQRLRGRINCALKRKKISKSQLFFDLVGCSSDFLISWIENQFHDGMSWDNYGLKGWHIDHIRPCASFDLTDPEQQKQCFHYTNLQPLWAFDNISKKDKWNG